MLNDRFYDRKAAGQALAKALSHYANRKDVYILALPRGGVPVAFEIAKTLSLPLDLLLVRKLGVPGHEELAMGAIALGQEYFLNQDIIKALNISKTAIDKVIAKEQLELTRRNELYRQGRPLPQMTDKTIILVDDGLATGATVRAAIRALRAAQANYILVAVPVGAASTCQELRQEADEVVCLRMPEPFYSVGLWYQDFSQTTDKEVQHLLQQSLSIKDGIHV